MIPLDKYLKDPCGSLSIPYWKHKSILKPNNIKIIHDSDYSDNYLSKYDDERYFRLYHNLLHIQNNDLKGFSIITATNKDIEIIVSIINQSYDDIQVNVPQIAGYRRTPVFFSDLWVLVKCNSTDEYVGCGIADFDSEAKELVLEWVQVLPNYRNRKIGQAIVNELLNRAKPYAEFATVSGKIDNPTQPDILYKKCGFTGNDVWHLLTQKNK